MTIRILALLIVAALSLPAQAASVPIAWTSPTQWTDGTQLDAASIRHASVHCAPTTTGAFDLVAVVDGNPGRASIDIPGDRWCAVRIYAEIAPGVLRESDISARVFKSPKRPGVGSLLPDESVEPPNCPRGQTCPAP